MAPRILIIRLSALGDIIHTLPMLAALRNAYPEAQIGWLVEPLGAQLLEGHPLLDAVHVFPKKAWRADKRAALRGPLRELVNAIRERQYEIAIDGQGLMKSAAWSLLCKAPRRIGFSSAEARELAWLAYTDRVTPAPHLLHVIQRNLALLGPLGIGQPDPIISPVHLPGEARRKAREVVGEPAPGVGPFIIVNPGAGWASKIWPTDRLGRLAGILVERYGARVAVAWGPGEEHLVGEVLEGAGVAQPPDFTLPAIPAEAGVYPMPPTRFSELGAIIERARLFVGGDTGPTHLAAALGVPTVSMMGPLDARRNGPLGDHCVTIQHGVPRKAPFWANHRRWCDPKTDLRHVSVEEVLEACVRMLGKDERK